MKKEPKKTKKIKVSIAEPVQDSDGSWRVVSREGYEEIPDLGRDYDMCNICGWSTYPDCKETCDVYKKRPKHLNTE